MADLILPDGWFKNTNETGHTYYYSTKGHISWLPPPPRPNAPRPLETFAEMRAEELARKNAHPDDDDSAHEGGSHRSGRSKPAGPIHEWAEDASDVGLPASHPPPVAEVTTRMDAVRAAMVAANRNFKRSTRHDIQVRTWGGEPHPRLGCGKRLQVGYRPPPPWQPEDNLRAEAQAASKNPMREWMVDASEASDGAEDHAETYLVSPPTKRPFKAFRGLPVVQVLAGAPRLSCVALSPK